METIAPVPVVSAREIADVYERNTSLVHRHTAGLSNSDSLLQPQPGGNCINWILGHMAVHRDFVLDLLGETPALDSRAHDRYGRGSAPVVADGPDILPLDRLLDILDDQVTRIGAALERSAPAQLATEWKPESDITVSGRAAFLAWHDTYHLGQLDQLRQLAGTNDQVIP